MVLKLNGMAVDCVIGDLPEERERLQRLRVDVVLTIGSAAGETDSLSDTADYAALTGRIRRALVDGRFRLIERAARVVADVCLAEASVRGVRAEVTKVGSVAFLESATAICEDGKAFGS